MSTNREPIVKLAERVPREPSVGDIVGIKLNIGEWLIARVVSCDANASEFSDSDALILLYVYKYRLNELIVPTLLPLEDLLISPVIVNLELWSTRRCRFIESRPIPTEERLETHCFWVPEPWREAYYDGFGNKLPERIEPCGTLVMYTVQGLGKLIAAALQLID